MAPERFTELLEAAKKGSESAWTEIYRSLAPAVLGYLRSNGAREPEDVLSEAFLQVARDLPGFEGDEQSFRSWVFTVAHHRLIDASRYTARRPVEPVAEPPEPEGAATDAEQEALELIGFEEVHRILGTLSEEQRTVVLLRIVGDLSVQDVAKAIGKKPGAVKQLHRRGLATARRQLQRKDVPESEGA
jgi:RNA polymerase sigma-70 factor, ECF subfamily